MKILKKIALGLGGLLVLVLMVAVAALAVLKARTSRILDDYGSIYSNSKYSQAQYVEGVDVFVQDVSCGYAVIELFAKWSGNQEITEQSLYDHYGKVVTSTGKSFEEEMNKQFSEYKTTMYKYQKSTELIDRVYGSLANGVPVPFEWAALHEGEWTLHYSLVIGMDIPNDKVTVANPYGYIEEISVKDFINRTSFEAYEKMPIFFKLGFAFGIFEKNTVFIVERK